MNTLFARMPFWALALHACAIAPLAVRAVDVPPVDSATAERLAAGLRLQTISFDGAPERSGPAFLQLHEHLARSFPLVHQHLRREVVGGFSLLFTWPGRDPDAEPLLLSAHQDVVPVDPATESSWRQPPFSGAVTDGAVWGRGAWDDKGNLFAMLEAVERLLADGFVPRRTVYLAFGHDEEMGSAAGQHGAQGIAAVLRARGVRLDFVLDEGLVVVEDALPGLTVPAALIGVAEKGYLTVELSTQALSGHSSSPPLRSAIATLSRALLRLETHQLPARINGVARQSIDALAPHVQGPTRLVLNNLWLFEPVVRAQLVASPSGNAMLRTTAALTRFSAGQKDNTLPGEATATVNFRLLPGDHREAVLAHVRRVIEDDTVAVRASGPGWEASPVSATTARGYRQLEAAIHAVFPEAVVAPGLMVGATDSRAYADLARQTYRFSPLRARPTDLSRLHGIDERLALSSYAEMIAFYRRLLELA